MDILKLNDTKKRMCAVCSKQILKGKLMVKYEEVIDNFNNTRMWFAHLDCLVKRLKEAKEELKNPTITIERY